MEQSAAPVRPVRVKCVRGSVFECVCVCVRVPRLPLLPKLGSLASAIQLYSGGMETGLRSPGTTNQQSESRLGGGSGGCRGKAVTERQRGRQLEGWTGETKCVQVRGKERETLEGLLRRARQRSHGLILKLWCHI